MLEAYNYNTSESLLWAKEFGDWHKHCALPVEFIYEPVANKRTRAIGKKVNRAPGKLPAGHEFINIFVTKTERVQRQRANQMIYKSDFSPPNLMDLSMPNGFLCSLTPESRSSMFFS